MCCASTRAASSNPVHLQLHNPLLYLPILLARAAVPVYSCFVRSVVISRSGGWELAVARWLWSIVAPFVPCSMVTIFSRSCSRNQFSLYWLVCIETRRCTERAPPRLLRHRARLLPVCDLRSRARSVLDVTPCRAPLASNTECCRWLAVATVTPARARPQRLPCCLDNGPSSFALTPRARRHHHRP
jgi:hypothetical protein